MIQSPLAHRYRCGQASERFNPRKPFACLVPSVERKAHQHPA
jgi:hypothetical protein